MSNELVDKARKDYKALAAKVHEALAVTDAAWLDYFAAELLHGAQSDVGRR